jgi:hypothetical protein
MLRFATIEMLSEIANPLKSMDGLDLLETIAE